MSGVPQRLEVESGTFAPCDEGVLHSLAGSEPLALRVYVIVITSAEVLVPGSPIDSESLELRPSSRGLDPVGAPGVSKPRNTLSEVEVRPLASVGRESLEREDLASVVRACWGNGSAAAWRLWTGGNTLLRKRKGCTDT